MTSLQDMGWDDLNNELDSHLQEEFDDVTSGYGLSTKERSILWTWFKTDEPEDVKLKQVEDLPEDLHEAAMDLLDYDAEDESENA